ncbi:MAG: ATP-NAD kinase family protein [Methanomicrobiales archaeon]|nr:ATP-NAD kinase family protein [Methanomicrobiales archaeon]MDI6876172.1 ATP-NAD kinase family protein [Methanomicrobiales archaeon]
MRTVGFLINPIAGMGGAVGLKGTDGQVDEALSRGAVPQAGSRAVRALRGLKGIRFLCCSGAMGEEALREAGIADYAVAYTAPRVTSAEDTRAACRAFLARGADLILFCGGDGTARDVFDVVDRTVPILGIPAGVKMYSAVFAVTPDAVREILDLPDPPLRDSEVMDVDEEAYRDGVLATRLHGYARTPYIPSAVQAGKAVFESSDEERAKEEIARFIAEVMLPDTLYILGAGTTVEAIARRLGIGKTLLGADAVLNGRLVARDLDEKALRELVEDGNRSKLIVSPIGAQGFILGRGTQPISPAVIRRIGIENIIVVGTPHKLRETPALYVDSGDPRLDAAFGDSVLVVCGYRMAQRKRIAHPRRETAAAPC